MQVDQKSDETATKPALIKTAAQTGCPKYISFIQSYASKLQTCATAGNGAESCYDYLLDIWDPIFECMDLIPPETLSDWYNVQMEFAEHLEDADEAKHFVSCLCGDESSGADASIEASGGVTVDLPASGTFTGSSTNAAAGNFTGSSTSAGQGSFNGSTTAAGEGNFTGTSTNVGTSNFTGTELQ
ncbi:MAG TPA: hypothetical protein DCQ83_03885 [Fibrobacteres bacterium]|jgi:hypothetical protein|nr:hypothetical protein [Fibrobacterota bacterium]